MDGSRCLLLLAAAGAAGAAGAACGGAMAAKVLTQARVRALLAMGGLGDASTVSELRLDGLEADALESGALSGLPKLRRLRLEYVRSGSALPAALNAWLTPVRSRQG